MKNNQQSACSQQGHRFSSGFRLAVFLLVGLCISLQVTAQAAVKISGTVTDDKGEPIIGATVQVPGTPIGTATDINGAFELQAAEGVDLRVSYVGYKPSQVKTTKAIMRIIMLEDTRNLGEAVVVGYGVVKRENLLGSVSALTGQEIEDIPAGNLSQTLVGKLAAVGINETTGRPGSTTALTIRTSGSFSVGSDIPLFIINGVICESQEEFDMLDPSQIESISILKDAAAAVYGARAAGGAVIVTLKKGKEGKARITYSGQAGYTTPTRFPDMLSAYDQAVLMNEYSRPLGLSTPVDYRLPGAFTSDELDAFRSLDYNWVDAAWRNSYQLRNNLTVSGGSDKVRYFVGGSLWNENGNFVNIDVKKYTIRTSLEADVTDELTASLELSTNNSDKVFPYMQGDGQDNMNGMYGLLLYTPRWQPYKVGDKFVDTGTSAANPLALLESDCYKYSKDVSTTLNAALTFKPKAIPGLTANVRYSYTDGHSHEKQYTSPYLTWEYPRYGTNNHLFDLGNPTGYYVNNTGDNERITLAYGRSNSYQLNASVNYVKQFGKHNLAAMVNYEQSENEGDGTSIRAVDQQVPGLERLEAYKDVDIYSSSRNTGGRLGFIGRFNYDYAGKYLLETSFREEASVKFSPGNRWGFFPQAALGWRVSEEDFFKDAVPFMDYLKIRASAGLLGQDNGLGAYEYLYSYVLSSGQFFGTAGDNGMRNGLSVIRNGLVTDGVTWEKNRTFNVGIDTKFLDEHLDFSIDAYYKHVWDIFDNASVTYTDIVGTVGSSIPKINSGIVNAWGTDVELGYTGRLSDVSNFVIKGNFSWGDNKIIRKQQDSKWKNTYAWQEGGPTNRGENGYKIDYGFAPKGLFQSQEQVDAYLAEHPGMTFFNNQPAVGMLVYKDVARAGDAVQGEPYYVNEPDGKVDEFDLVPISKRSGTPFAYGFSFGYNYKTFRIDMTFTGGWGGHTIMNKAERTGPYIDGVSEMNKNALSYWNDSWSIDNPTGVYPNVTYKSLNEMPSEFWLRSSSILRLRSINLSYTLPRDFTVKYGLPSARVFLTSTNLLTLYSQFGYKDANLARYYDYPLLRAFNLGVSLSL
jgi:TonB-linked SusC/RagA family outer membrane protein